jgi:hypothetical protein
MGLLFVVKRSFYTLSAQIIYDRETASALDMGTKRAMRALLRR